MNSLKDHSLAKDLEEKLYNEQPHGFVKQVMISMLASLRIPCTGLSKHLDCDKEVWLFDDEFTLSKNVSLSTVFF